MRRPAAAVALALALLPTATAGASVYTDVLHVYQLNGSIPPCRFSSAQLSAALKQIDTYGQQYFADFSGAIQNALTARAAGACSAAALHPASSALHAPAGVPAPPLPASVRTPTDSNLPAPILVMTVLVVLVAVVLAVRAVVVATGFTDWLRRRR